MITHYTVLILYSLYCTHTVLNILYSCCTHTLLILYSLYCTFRSPGMIAPFVNMTIFGALWYQVGDN
jgi:hypothetical protein